MSEEPQRTATFYELPSPEEAGPLVCACTERAYDDLLWTFAQSSFIPHVRVEEAEEPIIEPVLLFSDGPGEMLSDVLVLRTPGDMPEWFERFPHIVDFAAVYDEELRQAGRERYRTCKEAGYGMDFISVDER
jgi:DNA polymerase-3 subunit chi